MIQQNATTLEVTPHLDTTGILLTRVVAAVDFSTQTPHVMEAATTIANFFSSELIVVNAATPAIYGIGTAPSPIETFEVNLDIAKAQMSELLGSTPNLATVKHREIVAYADAGELVAQVVKDSKVQLVIAGSHGARGMERLALGSVAESILRRLPCPTLIVGPRYKTDHFPFRSILFATDLQDTGLRAAQYASGLAEHFHGKLTMLHVVEPKTMQNELQPEFSEERTLQGMQRLLPPDLSTYATAKLRIEYGKPGDLIIHTSKAEASSLIVLGIREGGTLPDHAPWSTLAQVVREAHCPVLVVRRSLK